MFVGQEAAVPYRASQLPSLYSPEEAARRQIFHGLMDSDLPGLAIRNTGSTLEEAIDRLSLPAEITVDTSFVHDFKAEKVDPSLDLPIHFDPWPNYEQTLLVFHHTSQGAVDARFFRPGVALWRSMHEGEGLPPDTDQLFRSGLVWSDILNPKAYQTQLRAGSLLVFKAGGAAPFIHHFRTVKAPRISQSTWGIMIPS